MGITSCVCMPQSGWTDDKSILRTLMGEVRTPGKYAIPEHTRFDHPDKGEGFSWNPQTKIRRRLPTKLFLWRHSCLSIPRTCPETKVSDDAREVIEHEGTLQPKIALHAGGGSVGIAAHVLRYFHPRRGKITPVIISESVSNAGPFHIHEILISFSQKVS